MSRVFLLPLTLVQPSRLYISSAKLAQVQARWWPRRVEQLSPIPVVLLDDVIVATDGHTRAFAAYRTGLRTIQVAWDADRLAWEAYRVCLDWCLAEGIRTIEDLDGRVVSPSVYEDLWLDRCRRMHTGLAKTATRGKGLKPGLPTQRQRLPHCGSVKGFRREIFLAAAAPSDPLSSSGG